MNQAWVGGFSPCPNYAAANAVSSLVAGNAARTAGTAATTGALNPNWAAARLAVESLRRS